MHIILNVLVLFHLFFSAIVFAAPYQTLPLSEQGMTTSYVDVPTGYHCFIKIPDKPTALCQGADGTIYHMKGGAVVMQGLVNPEQYLHGIQQQVINEGARILGQYSIPIISQHLLRTDAPLYFKQGQQIASYALDIEDRNKNEIGIAVFAIHHLPNNGSPITVVSVYGISKPMSHHGNFDSLRGELVRFVQSYRLDNRFVQSTNAQHVQFQNNLRAKENAFYTQQNIIHQNNMNALDNSHNSYMRRSQASDRMQQQTIDSIHERQQLVDPTTGKRYQADGYAQYNYVDPNDPTNSVRSNNPNFNPNVNTNQGQHYNQLQQYNYGR